MPRRKRSGGKPQARRGRHHVTGQEVRHMTRRLSLPAELMKKVK
jgi:hypothetical protein